MPPHLLTALRRCPVPYKTLLRHPRRVVSTYDELKLAIHGLSSPCPPCARLIWNLVVAVHVSTFCTYRHYHYVIAGISLLYATLIQLAEALLPGRPVSIDARRTPLPDILCPSLPPCPPADRSADAPLRADKPGTSPAPTQTASPPQQPDTGHVVSRNGSVLMHASLNVGGPDITPNRFCNLLSGFQPLPHTICIQEFKPSASAHIRDFERVALHWGFHLLHSSPSSKDGVAILVHTSISPKPPPLHIDIPGTLVSVELHLHPNPLVPPMRLASFYGPHTLKEKRVCQPHLDTLLRDSYLIMGD